jgi:hypothetical protein
LRDDDEEYVRRSVANNLNDIAKDHPDLVATLAGEWMHCAGKQRQRLLRHACRTLIKNGHPAALEVFGFQPPEIELSVLRLDTRIVQLGGTLDFATQLRSTAKTAQSLVIDYVLHLRKANGSHSAKVFKWKVLQIAAGETISLQRTHPIRAVTTRRYYEGMQSISLRINGEDMGHAEFTLRV